MALGVEVAQMLTACFCPSGVFSLRQAFSPICSILPAYLLHLFHVVCHY